jgi:hypothetical protein
LEIGGEILGQCASEVMLFGEGGVDVVGFSGVIVVLG